MNIVQKDEVIAQLELSEHHSYLIISLIIEV